jgi:hypothetical protein
MEYSLEGILSTNTQENALSEPLCLPGKFLGLRKKGEDISTVLLQRGNIEHSFEGEFSLDDAARELPLNEQER